jgi:hypothetical protein
MPRVQVSAAFPGSVHEAETCWYDIRRWPSWVDGIETVEHVDPDWPNAGASVRWRSGPAGRGQVTERVIDYVPLEGQTVESEDDAVRARQRVSFSPAGDNVEVEVSFSWQYKRRSLSTVLGALFIRRAFTISLQATLSHFGLQLAARRSD